MPDLITHYFFTRAAVDTLPAEGRAALHPAVLSLAALGPDPWYALQITSASSAAERGDLMHNEHTGDFLRALAAEGRDAAVRGALFSYLCGFLCHYALDAALHPYIIARAGVYDGTADTLPFRGAHMRLERAIDWHTARTLRQLPATRFPLRREILPLRALPREMCPALDRIGRSVYGWESTAAELDRAIRAQRLCYTLFQDPWGVVNAAARRLDDGKSPLDYRQLSFYGKELDESRLDYLNLSHAPWRHPFAPDFVYTESVPELTARAGERAAALLQGAWEYVYLRRDNALGALIGDLSYTTGLDWRLPAGAAVLSLPVFPA